VNSYWLRRFQKLNLFVPLDNYLTPQILKRRFTTAVKLGKIGDKIYSLNWTLDPLVLFYNKVVMENAGLDPDSPPKTIDELADQSIKINKAEPKNVHGFCLPFDMSEHSLLCMYPLLLCFGGGFSDPIGNVMIDSRENLQALSWLSRFYRDGGMDKPTTINDARILFASDYLGFLLDNPGGRGHFRQISGIGKEFDGHYGVSTIPVGPSGKSESVLLSHSLAISRNCRNPEEAYSWIEHLAADEENAQTYFDLFGPIPCDRNFLHNAYFAEDPFASVLIHQIETASVGPIDHPLFYKSTPFLVKIFSDIIHAERDPEEALSFLRKTIGILAEVESLGVV
jgi:multiple sugar transport system substrate-binding protein